MAAIKKFNWVKRSTAWEYSQAWRSHRSRMVQKFLSESSATSTAFLNAQNNLSVGLAALAAQASIQRTQAEISAVRGQAASAAGSIDRLA